MKIDLDKILVSRRVLKQFAALRLHQQEQVRSVIGRGIPNHKPLEALKRQGPYYRGDVAPNLRLIFLRESDWIRILFVGSHKDCDSFPSKGATQKVKVGKDEAQFLPYSVLLDKAPAPAPAKSGGAERETQGTTNTPDWLAGLTQYLQDQLSPKLQSATAQAESDQFELLEMYESLTDRTDATERKSQALAARVDKLEPLAHSFDAAGSKVQDLQSHIKTVEQKAVGLEQLNSLQRTIAAEREADLKHLQSAVDQQAQASQSLAATLAAENAAKAEYVGEVALLQERLIALERSVAADREERIRLSFMQRCWALAMRALSRDRSQPAWDSSTSGENRVSP